MITGIIVILSISLVWVMIMQAGIMVLKWVFPYQTNSDPMVRTRGNVDTGRMIDLVEGKRQPTSEMEERFVEYHKENPAIYEMFHRFTMQALRAGHEEVRSKMIFERIRWEMMITAADDAYAVNNNFTAYYARLWMEMNNMERVFKTRALRSEKDH